MLKDEEQASQEPVTSLGIFLIARSVTSRGVMREV